MIDTGCPCSMCRKNRALGFTWRGDCNNAEDRREEWATWNRDEAIRRLAKYLSERPDLMRVLKT